MEPRGGAPSLAPRAARWTCVLLATLASGCLASQVVHYEGHGVKARGTRPPLSRSSFYDLTFGRPERPWDGSPAFTLVLPDGRRISSAELTPAFVRSLPGTRTVGAFWWVRFERWPARVEEILLEPYAFALLDDRVVAVQACALPQNGGMRSCRDPSVPVAAPRVGDAEGKRIERLPLSYARITELFGKPERLSYDLESFL